MESSDIGKGNLTEPYSLTTLVDIPDVPLPPVINQTNATLVHIITYLFIIVIYLIVNKCCLD